MHEESYKYMMDAVRRHVGELPKDRVLDVGASGRRAHYRKIWEGIGWSYEGCDLEAKPNIDTVLEDPFVFPYADDSFGAVISGQMLEHNEFFWLSFIEMARVLKMGGLMVHIAPSRGTEHRAPQDCWRFYRDGMTALAKWTGMEIVEATTDWAPEHFTFCEENNNKRRARLMKRTMRTENTVWGDTVGVFRKVMPVQDSPAAHYLRHFARVLGETPRKSLAIAAE